MSDNTILYLFFCLAIVAIVLSAIAIYQSTATSNRRRHTGGPPLFPIQPTLTMTTTYAWYNLIRQDRLLEVDQALIPHFGMNNIAPSSRMKGKRFVFILPRWPRTTTMVVEPDKHLRVTLPLHLQQGQEERMLEEVQALATKIVWDHVADMMRFLVQSQEGKIEKIVVRSAKHASTVAAIHKSGVTHVVVFPHTGDVRPIVEGYTGEVIGMTGLLEFFQNRLD